MNRGNDNIIANVYAIQRRNEKENLLKWESVGNNMLLWHGTRAENIVSIIQTGFRISPSGVHTTGSLFGEGIDMTNARDLLR